MRTFLCTHDARNVPSGTDLASVRKHRRAWAHAAAAAVDEIVMHEEAFDTTPSANERLDTPSAPQTLCFRLRRTAECYSAAGDFPAAADVRDFTPSPRWNRASCSVD